MSNATRFARKPLVAAVLTTLAAFSVQAEEAVNKDVTLSVGTGDMTVSATITDEQTWNESWAKKFNDKFTNADGKVTINEGSDDANKSITITKTDSSSGKLTNSLSSLTLNVALDVAEGGSFVNTGNITTSKAVTVTGGFDNSKGTITAKDNVTISDLADDSDLESAPAAIAMGNITIEGNGVVLTNNDKGYTLKSEEKDGKEGDKHARVTFGKVTLKNGASFTNIADAMDSGSSLTIEANAGQSTIAGTSAWGTITAEKTNAVSVSGTLTTDSLVIGKDLEANSTIDGFVSVTGTGDSNGKFTINKGLTAETFANGGSLDLSSGQTGALASGASLTLGKVQAFKQGDDGKITTDGDYHQGTVKIQNHKATWVESKAADADADKDETENKGAWDATRFGDVTAFNNAKLEISGNKADDATITDHGYAASLSFGSLTLANTSLKVTPSAKVETLTGFIDTALAAVNDGVEADKQIKLDTSAWTKDDYAKNLEKFLGTLTEAQKTKFEESYNGSVDKLVKDLAIDSITGANVEHKIEGSDVAIGTLAFKSVESEVGASLPATTTTVAADGNDADTPADRGSVALAPVTSVKGAQTLLINNSRVEVGSLSLADGTLNITDSQVIIAKTGTINGTLTAESGYLGLNVSTSMADRVAAQKKAADAGAASGLVVEVGGPVVLGEKAVVTFGKSGTSGSTGSGTATADAADQTGAKLTFAGDTTLKFDASRFNQSALFTAEGAKGAITADGTITLDGANLTWGAYKLFDNFDQSQLNEDKLIEGVLSASDAWKNQVGNNFTITMNDNGEWIIVAGGTTVEGSGLNVGAKNLVSKLFSGDRASGADLQLVNSILSTGASLDEISSMINSVTGLGAISGVKAMTVDFQGYTADMIEHHAATSPKEMGGWWVQPMGARLKTDDLSMGGSAYGYSIDTIGIMGGFDAKLKNGWTVGAAASNQSGEADGEGDVLPVSTDVTNVGLHLWGSRMYGETNVIGTLSYVTTDGDATMQAGGLELASELKAKALSAGVRAEREFKTGAFTLTPHAGARISIVDMDDYEIAAGGTKLFDVSEDKATIFEVPVGVTVQTPAFMFQTFEVKPYVDLTVRGRFGDTESTYTLEGSSTTDSIDYDVSGSFVGDLKVGYMSTYKNLNLGMSYGLSAGDAGRQNHALEATLRVDF